MSVYHSLPIQSAHMVTVVRDGTRVRHLGRCGAMIVSSKRAWTAGHLLVQSPSFEIRTQVLPTTVQDPIIDYGFRLQSTNTWCTRGEYSSTRLLDYH